MFRADNLAVNQSLRHTLSIHGQVHNTASNFDVINKEDEDVVMQGIYVKSRKIQ